MKHLYPRAHFIRSPAVPGLNGVCGRPPLWPAGSPVAGVRLASGRLCFHLSGSRVFGAGVPHLLCADKSAGSVGHVKCLRRCPPRRDGQTSWCSALVFKGQRRKRRNAAASGTVLKRELSHQKSGFRFARFRRASSMIRKEITTRSARMPHNPFHGRGRASKGRSCSFLGLGRGNVDSPCRRSRLANGNAPSPSCDRCPSISEV